jgi:hypothetical protein
MEERLCPATGAGSLDLAALHTIFAARCPSTCITSLRAPTFHASFVVVSYARPFILGNRVTLCTQRITRTATARLRAGGEWNRDYRAGNLRRVRFTLDADDFESWRMVVSRYPDLTTNWIAKLEQTARDWGQSTSGWYCRPEPLPLTKVVAIHTRAYSGHRWEAFDWSTAEILEVKYANPNIDCLGVKLGDKIYMSGRKVEPNGYHGYKIAVPMRQDFWNPTELVWSD